MARNRIIYQSQALYVGDLTSTEDATKNDELHRVQDISFNVDVPRVDITEFGQLASIGREITEPPTVSLDFSYYLHNGLNESNLGFNVNGTKANARQAAAEQALESAIKDIIDTSENKDEFNYYILTKPEGQDAHEDTNDGNDGLIAIGNGFITSLTLEAAVGDYATASCSVEAANITFGDYSSGGTQGRATNPAIVQSTGLKVNDNNILLPKSTSGLGTGADSSEDLIGITAIRSGDISIQFFSADELADTDGGTAAEHDADKKLKMGGAALPSNATDGAGEPTSMHIQNFSVELPLSRTPLTRVGSFFPFSREIDFPITGSFSISANVADFQGGDLYDMVCGDDKKNAVITMKNKCSTNLGDGPVEYQIVIKGATLDSQNFSHGIGDQQSVDLTFSVPLGANASSGDGIFLLGSTSGDVATGDTGSTNDPVATATRTGREF
tara:strand:+ start:1195 stop:2523 length:1329 start_codon:yes stop_codon:yes gene_type:complete